MKINLDSIANDIMHCKQEDCPYRSEFKNPYGRNGSQWSFWLENEFLLPGLPSSSPAKVNKYVPFKYDCKSKVVLIASRPSTSDFPSSADVFFVETLVDCKLITPVFEVQHEAFVYYEGALVTDVINCRGLASAPVGGVPMACKNFLHRQLAAVNPEKIIIIGKSTKQILSKYVWDSTFPWQIDQIPDVVHWSGSFRFGKRGQFVQQLEDALKHTVVS